VWPVLLNTVEGVRAADEVLTDTCRSYRIRGGLRVWQPPPSRKPSRNVSDGLDPG
jgi:hypothetical protein